MIEEDLFEVTHFEEPEIHLRGGSVVSPKRGLYRFGPRLEDDVHETIKVGAIGDPESLRRLKDFFLDLETQILPEKSQSDDGGSISPHKIPYPGANDYSNLKVSFAFKEIWKRRVYPTDLQSIEAEPTVENKMERFLDLISSDINNLNEQPEPDVIVVCIPERIMDECTPDDEDNANVSADGSDLRSRIKLVGMEHEIPTQLINSTSPVYKR